MQIGYGFTSKDKAKKAAYFILNGGLEEKRKIKKWWSEHQDLSNRLSEIAFYAMKDGESLTNEELEKYAVEISNELKITDFQISYLKYL